MVNRLYLFLPTTFLGWVLTLVFRDLFIHAAVHVHGDFWDSNPLRGTFGRAEINLKGLRYIELEFSGDLSGFVLGMNGRRHKWRGVIGWLFGWRKRSLYSFEMIWLALKSAGIVDGNMPARVTGTDLLQAVLGYQSVLANGSAFGYVRQLLRTIRFEHEPEVSRLLDGANGEAVANAVICSVISITGAGSIGEALALMQKRRALLLEVEERLYVLMGPLRRLARA